ncbi:hypothetical protein H5410_024735 [Solanum commersonii]|uniref:Uncharacterized protein n=1 Tax=Solanum commersonii TaxID=4109 RepID=A0A9J5ZMT7_SOLCO|nr:hypothetical protein H5410_024735 [Solanum commersonii]
MGCCFRLNTEKKNRRAGREQTDIAGRYVSSGDFTVMLYNIVYLCPKQHKSRLVGSVGFRYRRVRWKKHEEVYDV